MPPLPGWGPDPALAEEDAHVRWLRSWLVRERLSGRPHLVGLDYGGVLAAAVADLGASLTLTSTALGWAWLPAQLTALPPLHRWFYEQHGGRRWLAMGVSPARRAELLAAFEPELAAHVDLPGHMRRIALGMRPRAQGRLRARLDLPVLALWGSADRSVPPVLGRALARGIRGGRFEAIPGGRHYVAWEQPDAYAASLTRFWAAVGS